MAQGASGGQLARVHGDNRVAITKQPIQRTKKTGDRAVSVDTSEAMSVFGYRLDERMQAYSSATNEFGHPGNTVDHWRLQFNGSGARFTPANHSGDRGRY